MFYWTRASTDYISEEISEWLEENGVEMENSSKVVCSGFKEVCQKCRGSINVKLKFTNEWSKQRVLALNALTINTNYDLVIGRPSIVKNSLILDYPSLFADGKVVDELIALARGLAQQNALKVIQKHAFKSIQE